MDEMNKVGSNTYWIGVEDRKTALFERLWPMPMGVAYNSYLILGTEKTALIDSVPDGSEGRFLDRVERLLSGRQLDYCELNCCFPALRP